MIFLAYKCKQLNTRQYLGNVNAQPYQTTNTTSSIVSSRRREPTRRNEPYRNIGRARQERNQRLPKRNRTPLSNPGVIAQTPTPCTHCLIPGHTAEKCFQKSTRQASYHPGRCPLTSSNVLHAVQKERFSRGCRLF